MKRILISSIALLFTIVSIINIQASHDEFEKCHFRAKLNKRPGPMTYPEIKSKYVVGGKAFKREIENIITFHTKVLDSGLTAYEELFKEFSLEQLEAFKEAFDVYTGSRQQAILMDIDEIIFSSIVLWQETNYEGIAGGGTANYQFRVNKRSTVIRPMIDFCAALREIGYSIIFVTSRRKTAELERATREHLEECNIKVNEEDGLILTPLECYQDKHFCRQQYNQRLRKQLSKKYHISGCIGKHPDFYQGKHTGLVTAQFPNFLY